MNLANECHNLLISIWFFWGSAAALGLGFILIKLIVESKLGNIIFISFTYSFELTKFLKINKNNLYEIGIGIVSQFHFFLD